jgi:REase_MTES_1575
MNCNRDGPHWRNDGGGLSLETGTNCIALRTTIQRGDARARDRVYLVRSVQEEELNPNDLKARVIRHFKDPMSGRHVASGELESRCDSDFEREILRRLVQAGYRVRPQVGSAGYSIDLVVEGSGDRRLAIECDGDKYHGPERWADDMARQRTENRL